MVSSVPPEVNPVPPVVLIVDAVPSEVVNVVNCGQKLLPKCALQRVTSSVVDPNVVVVVVVIVVALVVNSVKPLVDSPGVGLGL